MVSGIGRSREALPGSVLARLEALLVDLAARADLRAVDQGPKRRVLAAPGPVAELVDAIAHLTLAEQFPAAPSRAIAARGRLVAPQGLVSSPGLSARSELGQPAAQAVGGQLLPPAQLIAVLRLIAVARAHLGARIGGGGSPRAVGGGAQGEYLGLGEVGRRAQDGAADDWRPSRELHGSQDDNDSNRSQLEPLLLPRLEPLSDRPLKAIGEGVEQRELGRVEHVLQSVAAVLLGTATALPVAVGGARSGAFAFGGLKAPNAARREPGIAAELVGGRCPRLPGRHNEQEHSDRKAHPHESTHSRGSIQGDSASRKPL